MNVLRKTLAAATLALAVSSAFAAQPDAAAESHTQAFLNALNSSGGKPLEQLAPAAARAVLTGAQNSVKVDLKGTVVSERSIDADGQRIGLTIVRPANAKGELPVFMFFHGGGWVLGDYPTHARLIHDLVVNSGAVAVYVNYTPSPEAHFPTAINQAYAATRWVAENGKALGVDSSRLAVAGNSVGGNMAAVVSLMAKEQGTPKLRFQLLLWPVTDANFDTASYQQYADGHFLTRNMMKWFWDNYTTDAAQRASVHASPLQASLEQLKGLPPALVQTAALDVLRDEGEAYARKLDAAGVPVTAVRYNGMIHDYGLLNPLSSVPEVQAAMRQAGQELKAHLR
ncbi:alpha/beta hydrolase fold domain-containing protein [Pseudomonas sp. NPDC007930]|uniref:alpha/beta hydrolase n=1 Tax=Pseudomonas sp. NPDC007930 TaxID=3364417 RepID=UPI0036EEE0DD